MSFDPILAVVICVVCYVLLHITRTLRVSSRQPWHSEVWPTRSYWSHTLQRRVIARSPTLTVVRKKAKPFEIGKQALQPNNEFNSSAVVITTQRRTSPPVYAHIWGQAHSLPAEWLKQRVLLMDSATSTHESNQTTEQIDTSLISRPVSTVDKMRFAGL